MVKKESAKEPSKEQPSLADALRALLIGRLAGTQEEICEALAAQGYEINQSKASRLLRKIRAIKVENEHGQVVYSLPREPAPPSMDTTLQSLIVDVVANENLVIIYTSPGSASMIARLLDYNQPSTEILGTLAGDDTIFVAPKSVKNTDKMFSEVKELLGIS